jgi:hypothetical protein
MPRGYRWMYYATGLPGWMRFGFSPGWVGRSPTGLGPGASFLMTGQWPTPQAQAFWQAMQSGQVPYPGYAPSAAGGFGQMNPTQEIDVLKSQADALNNQLEQIRARISELEKAGE